MRIYDLPLPAHRKSRSLGSHDPQVDVNNFQTYAHTVWINGQPDNTVLTIVILCDRITDRIVKNLWEFRKIGSRKPEIIILTKNQNQNDASNLGIGRSGLSIRVIPTGDMITSTRRHLAASMAWGDWIWFVDDDDEVQIDLDMMHENPIDVLLIKYDNCLLRVNSRNSLGDSLDNQGVLWDLIIPTDTVNKFYCLHPGRLRFYEDTVLANFARDDLPFKLRCESITYIYHEYNGRFNETKHSIHEMQEWLDYQIPFPSDFLRITNELKLNQPINWLISSLIAHSHIEGLTRGEIIDVACVLVVNKLGTVEGLNPSLLHMSPIDE